MGLQGVIMNKQELIDRFLELSKEREALKEKLKSSNEEINQLMKDIGEGEMFQDPATMLVYKIERPKGTFIEFKEIDYARTKKATETRGSLSKKEAELNGFAV